MTRLLIVEDLTLVAEALATLLGRQDDLEVVGTVGEGRAAIELVHTVRPDIVLLGSRLADIEGPVVVRTIHQQRPKLPILFLSHDDSELARFNALEAGACAYLHKSRSASELIDALRRAAKGDTLVSHAATTELRRRIAPGQALGMLTDRERETLRLMAQGLDTRGIARGLGIRYGTVRSHFRNLSGKLGAHSNIEAVAKGCQLGLCGGDSAARTDTGS